MTDHDLTSWVHEVARDIPDRSDDEAAAALREARSRDRRRRRARAGLLATAAAAVIGVIAWVAVPADDDIGVTSDGPSAPTTTADRPSDTTSVPEDPDSVEVMVDADLDAYTGVLPPLVTVSTDGHRVQLIETMARTSGEDQNIGLRPFATVNTNFPVRWAASADRGSAVVLVDAATATALHVDLATGDVKARWSNTISAAVAADHTQLARIETRPDGNIVVISDLQTGTETTYTPPPGGTHASGPLAWSRPGRLAVSQDDGSVAILEPDTTTDYAEATVAPGPLHAADWTNDGLLVGTCCTPSSIVTVDPDNDERTTLDIQAQQAVAVDGGGSPWGWIYLDANGDVRATQGPNDTVLLTGVSQLQW